MAIDGVAIAIEANKSVKPSSCIKFDLICLSIYSPFQVRSGSQNKFLSKCVSK